jgi:hypothetical protein
MTLWHLSLVGLTCLDKKLNEIIFFDNGILGHEIEIL